MRRIKFRMLCILMVVLIAIPQLGFADYNSLPTESDVSVTKDWTVKFNKALNQSTVTSENIKVVDQSGLSISAILEILSDQKSVSIKPTSPYAYNTKYTIVVDGVKSSDKDEMLQPVKKSFITQSPGISVVDSSEKVIENAAVENTASYKEKVQVTIPANTVNSGDTVSIDEIAGAKLHEFSEIKTISSYDISIGNKSSFNSDLTLRFKYDEAELRPEYSPNEQLAVAYFDEDNGRWVESDFTVDEQTGELVVTANHLTLWSIFGIGDDTVVSTAPNFRIYFNQNINAPRLGGAMSMDPIFDFAAQVRGFLIDSRSEYSGLGIKVPEMTKVYIDDWGADKTAEWGWFSKNIEIPVSYSDILDLKHDCAHEYFHAVQNQYLTFGTMIMNRWWMEATADYAAAGLMKTGKFSFVDGNYLKTSMGTVNGVHEYQSARFVEYLVSKKGVDFKKLWDYTASAWSSDMLGTIDAYLKQEHSTTLEQCYRDFANYIVFSNDSPAYNGSGGFSTPYEISSQSEMPVSVKNLEKDIALSEYTAQIWAIKPETEGSSPSRSLILELDEDIPSGMHADVFVLYDYQWDVGQPVPIATLSDSSKSQVVRVAPGQIVFVMVSNGKASSGNVKVKVKELDFNVTPSSVEGETGTEYDFKVEAQNIPKEFDAVTMEWDFGDGQTEGKENLSKGAQIVQVTEGKAEIDISHKYMEYGSYRLEVSMTDANKNVIAATAAEIEIPQQEIQVTIGAPRIVTYELATGATEAVHDFEAYASLQGSYIFEWDFGDGSEIKTTTGASSSISHTYTGVGTYSPSVTLYSAKGVKLSDDSITVTLEQQQADHEVTIPDAGLNAAVRSELSKPSGPIMKSDMEKLTKLEADWKNIKNLSGLEYASNAEYLNLYFNDITDLSPIAGLTGLQGLYISGNDNLVDISPVSGLVGLKKLYFNGSGNTVDITPVKNLVNLENLILGQNNISSISAVSNLKKLKELHIPDNNISDLSPVSGLVNLEWLILRDNPVSNLGPVSNLTKLTNLELNGCDVTDLSPLSGLASLQWLQMADNAALEDLKPLEGLVNLESLGLTRTYVRDITPLENLMKLKSLYLYETHLNGASEEVIEVLESRGCDVER